VIGSPFGQVKPGIETPTFRFVDKLHEPLSHCHFFGHSYN